VVSSSFLALTISYKDAVDILKEQRKGMYGLFENLFEIDFNHLTRDEASEEIVKAGR